MSSAHFSASGAHGFDRPMWTWSMKVAAGHLVFDVKSSPRSPG
nr:hypothetical protein [Kibdelosporangium sp. MJ126-NF4]